MILQKKISIIIPVYNVEPYIKDCLDSVVSQEYDGIIECILIDDCGTDLSMKIVESYVRDYDGVIDFKIIRHSNNRGLSAARNTGIYNSTGEYLLFLDSDDELFPNAIHDLTLPLRKENYDFVVGEYIVSGTNEKFPHLKLDEGEIEDISGSYMDRKVFMMAVNKLIRKDFLIKSNLYFEEGLLHEDEIWSFLLAVHADKGYVIKEKTYHYKVRKGSITTGNKTIKRITACFHLYKRMIETFSVTSKIQSRKTNDFIQNRLYLWIGPYLETEEEFCKEEYYRTRRQMSGYRTIILKCNKLKPRRFIRDLHLYLPIKIGFNLFKLRYKIFK